LVHKTVVVQCPHCGAKHDVPASLVGLPITCRKCNNSFPVPGVFDNPHARTAPLRTPVFWGAVCVGCALAVIVTVAAWQRIGSERPGPHKANVEGSETPPPRTAPAAGADDVSQQTQEMASSVNTMPPRIAFPEDNKLAEQLEALGFDPEEIATDVAEYVRIWGCEEAGTPRQVVNKALAATRDLDCSLHEFLTAAIKVSDNARAIGSTDEETLAALAAMIHAIEAERRQLRSARSVSDVRGTPLDPESYVVELLALADHMNPITDKDCLRFSRAMYSSAYRRVLGILPDTVDIGVVNEKLTRYAVMHGGEPDSGVAAIESLLDEMPRNENAWRRIWSVIERRPEGWNRQKDEAFDIWFKAHGMRLRGALKRQVGHSRE